MAMWIYVEMKGREIQISDNHQAFNFHVASSNRTWVTCKQLEQAAITALDPGTVVVRRHCRR